MAADPQSPNPEPAPSIQPSANQAANQAASKAASAAGKSEVTKLVDQLIATKRISYKHYQELSQLVLADGDVDEQERKQINRLFDAIQLGSVKIID
jgi:uncharacterized tellurite resistance protein B-like protein